MTPDFWDELVQMVSDQLVEVLYVSPVPALRMVGWGGWEGGGRLINRYHTDYFLVVPAQDL